LAKGIAVAGNFVVDYVKYIEGYPAEQTLTTIKGVERSTGGLACNCGLTLAKLDPELPVKVIGVLGGDEAGEYVLGRLAGHRSLDLSRVVRQGATSYTDVMTDAASGKRTFFHYRGSNALLAPEHFDMAGLGVSILHIGYILLLDSLDAPDPEYPSAMCRVLDSAQKAGIRTSIDVVSEDGGRFEQLVPPALKYVDYCIINELEASRTTGIPLRDVTGRLLDENLADACGRLMDMGVGRWAVVHAPELSCGVQRGGAFVREQSWKIPEGFKISSVGAGDAFAAGILYGAYSGWSLEKSLHIAGAVAAYSLSGAGGCDAIIPLPELLLKMEAWQ
jgi:sugar/nucleoside kinase (ribokinase family)